MPIIYTKADATTAKLVAQQIAKPHHKRLADCKLTVALLMASDAEGHAVYLHGYAAAAVVRITSYRDRCLGVEDAQIVFDAKVWADLTIDSRVALVDHELTHLQPILHKDGDVKLDDKGRPKIKMRQHDWELGGFAEVVQRHGEHALELQGIRHMQHRHGQMIFGFAMDDAVTLAAAAALLGTAKQPRKKKEPATDASTVPAPVPADSASGT